MARPIVTLETCNIAARCHHCGHRLEMRTPIVIVRFTDAKGRSQRVWYLHETCCRDHYSVCWQQLQEALRG